MIATLTTEPAPVNPIASEPIRAYKNDELDEQSEIAGSQAQGQSSFAELFAKLLHNTEEIEEIQAIDSIDSIFLDDGENQMDAFEKLHLFKETELSDADTKYQVQFPVETSVVNNLPDKNAPEGHIENLFLNLPESAQIDPAESNAALHQEGVFNFNRADSLKRTEQEGNFFAGDLSSPDESDAAALKNALAAAAQNEEAAGAQRKDGFGRKDRAHSGDASSLSNAKNEQVDTKSTQRVNPDNDKLSRLDEMRAAKNGRRQNGDFSIEVRDMRTADATNNNSLSSTEAGAVKTAGEAPVREITLDLRLPENNGSAAQNTATSWETKAGSAVENLLARELHQNFNGDIVRHASMALHDEGRGFIKINLKPESLGNVKIALELSDNKITGQIVVESEEALNAFRREISSLERAFRDSGFASAELNLSLTSDGQGFNPNTGEQENMFVPQLIASQLYERSYEDGAVNMTEVFIGRRQSSINMLA